MAEEPKIPKVVSSAPASQSLRLSPVEGFILSRIDGKATSKEIAASTGLSEAQVRPCLEKLESLGVITFVTKLVAPPKALSKPTSGAPGTDPLTGSQGAPKLETDGAAGEAEKQASIAKRVRRAMAAISRDDAELKEDVDIPEDLRLRILGMTQVIESLDYYEMLAIERTADKKAVKRSYFELAALFHPDRYFRKRLGGYKLKMETIFGRVTQAYETLSSKEQRSEYDSYLVDLDRTRGIEDLLRSAADEAQRVEQDVQRSASLSSFPEVPITESSPPGPRLPSPSSAPGSAPPKHTSGFYPAPTAPAPTPIPSRPPPGSVPGPPRVSDQARREALAMRLLGSRTLSSRAMPASGSNPIPPSGRPDGGDALKRRYEERIKLARRAQANKYISIGQEAEAKNDIVGAATAFKVALSFLPESEPQYAIAKAGVAKADEVLSETYLRQALYEDRSQHWGDAAKSWQRVIRGRPQDARAHERAAHALAKSRGDLHVAAEYAQRAIALDPQNPEYRITLAGVFVEAGLLLNARRELEAAQQLSPRNATIQALLKRVNKAG